MSKMGNEYIRQMELKLLDATEYPEPINPHEIPLRSPWRQFICTLLTISTLLHRMSQTNQNARRLLTALNRAYEDSVQSSSLEELKRELGIEQE